MNLFGRTVDFGRIKGMGGMKSNESTSLSGGQMQRIALYVYVLGLSYGSGVLMVLFLRRSRTFMRSSGSETSVGLLLFDEPSASLDPTAEHGM